MHWFPVSGKNLSLLVFLLTCLSGMSLGAMDFYIEPKAGMVYGMAREIVYPVGYSTDNPYLSELRWDIKPAYMLGLSTGLITENELEFRLNFQAALPVSSGEMYDYDWLYLNRTDWSHRSISDIDIQSAFIVDAEVSGKLLGDERWAMTITGGYHLDWWSWRDYTKEYLYSTSGSFPPKDYDEGPPADEWRDYQETGDGSTGIEYSVAYHVPLIGLGTVYKGERISFLLDFLIGPVIALDHDIHFNRGLQFLDAGIGGPWMSLRSRFGFSTGDLGEVFIDANISGFPEFSGLVSVYDMAGNYDGGTPGGAGFQFWRIGFDIGYSFQF